MSTLIEALHSSTNWLSLAVFTAALAAFVGLRVLWPSAFRRLCDFIGSKRFWLPVSLLFLGAFLAFLLGAALSIRDISITSKPMCLPLRLPSIMEPLSTTTWPFSSALLHDLRPILLPALQWALRILGSSLGSLKLLVLLANVCFLIVLAAAYRKVLDTPKALFAVAVVVAFMISGEPYMFQVRGDVLMPLMVAVALFGVLSSSRRTAVMLLFFATGLCSESSSRECCISCRFLFCFITGLAYESQRWRPAAQGWSGVSRLRCRRSP